LTFLNIFKPRTIENFRETIEISMLLQTFDYQDNHCGRDMSDTLA